MSLTSYGARLGTAHIAIESLLRQDLEPDAIILWLTADDAASLPPAIERQQRRGLVVRVCPDLRSYKKIVPALEAFPEATIVTADDDLMYPRAWLRELVKCQRAHGDAIPCHRAHRMTFDATAALRPYTDWEFEARGYAGPSLDLFPTTGAGVLFPPGSLPPETLDSETFLDLCPHADDVWMKAMLVLRGTSVRKVRRESRMPPAIRSSQRTSLANVNYGPEGRNDEQLEAVFERFDIVSRLRARD